MHAICRLASRTRRTCHIYACMRRLASRTLPDARHVMLACSRHTSLPGCTVAPRPDLFRIADEFHARLLSLVPADEVHALSPMHTVSCVHVHGTYRLPLRALASCASRILVEAVAGALSSPAPTPVLAGCIAIASSPVMQGNPPPAPPCNIAKVAAVLSQRDVDAHRSLSSALHRPLSMCGSPLSKTAPLLTA